MNDRNTGDADISKCEDSSKKVRSRFLDTRRAFGQKVFF